MKKALSIILCMMMLFSNMPITFAADELNDGLPQTVGTGNEVVTSTPTVEPTTTASPAPTASPVVTESPAPTASPDVTESPAPAVTPTTTPIATPNSAYSLLSKRAVLSDIKKYYTAELTIPISDKQKDTWVKEYIGDDDSLKLRFGVLNGTHSEMDTSRTRYKEEFNEFRGYYYLELVGSKKNEIWLFKDQYGRGQTSLNFISDTILNGNTILSDNMQCQFNRKEIILGFDLNSEYQLTAVTATLGYQYDNSKVELSQIGDPIQVDMSKYVSKDSFAFLIWATNANDPNGWALRSSWADNDYTQNPLKHDGSQNLKYINSNAKYGYTMEFDLKLDSSHNDAWLKKYLGTNNIKVKWDFLNNGDPLTEIELKGDNGKVFRGYQYVNDQYDGLLYYFASNYSLYNDGEEKIDGFTFQGGFVVEIQFNEDNTIKGINLSLVRPLSPPERVKQIYNVGDVSMSTNGVIIGNQIKVDMSTFKESGNPAYLVLLRKHEHWGDFSYALMDDKVMGLRKLPYYGYLNYTSPDNGDVVSFSVDYAAQFKGRGKPAGNVTDDLRSSYPWRREIMSADCSDVQITFISIQRYVNGKPDYPLAFLKLKGDIGEKWFISSSVKPLKIGDKVIYSEYEVTGNKTLQFTMVPLASFDNFNSYQMSSQYGDFNLYINPESDKQIGINAAHLTYAQLYSTKDINYTGDVTKLYDKWVDYEGITVDKGSADE